MLKLIVGLKGSGKTKTLIEMANKAFEETKGSVVCIEKGSKLIYDIKHEIRLIDTDNYVLPMLSLFTVSLRVYSQAITTLPIFS